MSVLNNDPLPADYDDLTVDGQRLARLSVVCDNSSPNSSAQAWHYFRQWYLVPYEGFFKQFVPSPQFHYQMQWDIKAYDHNVTAAPRGSAKSTCIGLERPLMNLCTQPFSDTTLLLATQDMVENRFDKIMQQLDDNPYLIADFGRLRPKRGSGVWSRKHLRLPNGATLHGVGIGGRKRGDRPDLLIMDDPETDKHGKPITQKLREEFDEMLFQVIIPMLREGCKLFWIGTMINRRTFIYSAFHGEDDRFTKWNRRLWAACRLFDGGMTDLLWPEMLTREFLQDKLDVMGPSAFSAEYLNAPVSSQARLLYRDAIRNMYTVDGPVSKVPRETPSSTQIVYYMREFSDKQMDELRDNNPVSSALGVLPNPDRPNKENSYVEVREPYAKWLSGLFIATLVDSSFTATIHSDYSCVQTVGFCRYDIMWLLDIWMARADSEVVISQIMKQGIRWHSHMVCPEAAGVQVRLVEEASRRIQDNAVATNWVPRVVPPVYPRNTLKGTRIALGLEWRFLRGRIKLPDDMRRFSGFYPPETVRAYRMLCTQFDDFTEDLALLPFDDGVDTTAMAAYIPRRSGTPQQLEPFVNTPKNLAMRGERYWPGTDIPIISGIPTNEITEEMLTAWEKSAKSAPRQRSQRMGTRFDNRRNFLRYL